MVRKTALFVTVLLVSVVLLADDIPEVEWQTSCQAALAKAKEDGRLVLLYVYKSGG